LRTFVYCYLWFGFLFVSGQISGSDSDSLHSDNRALDIEELANKLNIKMAFDNKYTAFEATTNDRKTRLSPNLATSLRFQLNYRYLSLGFSFSPSFLPGNGDEASKGKTNALQLGSALYFKHWLFRASFDYSNGFYAENKSVHNDATYLIFPEMNYYNIELGVGYSYNPNYSLKHKENHVERQKRSAGSFIPGLGLRLLRLEDNASPKIDKSVYKSDNISLDAWLGYFYTWVPKRHFYLTAGAEPGLGVIYTDLKTYTVTTTAYDKEVNLFVSIDSRGGVGYNGDNYFGGFFIHVSHSQNLNDNNAILLNGTDVFYQIFLGIRLDAPSWLRYSADEIDRIVPVELE
jgi:hypothetical protein